MLYTTDLLIGFVRITSAHSLLLHYCLCSRWLGPPMAYCRSISSVACILRPSSHTCLPAGLARTSHWRKRHLGINCYSGRLSYRHCTSIKLVEVLERTPAGQIQQREQGRVLQSEDHDNLLGLSRHNRPPFGSCAGIPVSQRGVSLYKFEHALQPNNYLLL